MTNRDKVLTMLTAHDGDWFSHARLSLRTGLSHQQVFQICKSLSDKGEIRRERVGREWWVCYGEPRHRLLDRALHPLVVFDWIGDERLRNIVRSDWEDTLRSVRSGIWKATVVLAGACLEGMLIAAAQKCEGEARNLLSNDFKMASIPSLPLGQLCRVAQRMGLVGPRVSDFLIKSRNLIHPGVSLKERDPVTRGDAEAAVKLLGECIQKMRRSLSKGNPQDPMW